MLNSEGYGVTLARLTYSLSLHMLPYMIRTRTANKNYIFTLYLLVLTIIILRACSHWALSDGVSVSNASLTIDILPILYIAIANNSVWTDPNSSTPGQNYGIMIVFLFLRLSNRCFKTRETRFHCEIAPNCVTTNVNTWLMFPNSETVEQLKSITSFTICSSRLRSWPCTHHAGRCMCDYLTCRPLEEKPHCHKHANLQCHLRHVGPVLVQQCLLSCLFVTLIAHTQLQGAQKSDPCYGFRD